MELLIITLLVLILTGFSLFVVIDKNKSLSEERKRNNSLILTLIDDGEKKRFLENQIKEAKEEINTLDRENSISHKQHMREHLTFEENTKSQTTFGGSYAPSVIEDGFGN